MNTLIYEKTPARAALARPLVPWYAGSSLRTAYVPGAISFGEFRRVEVVRDNASGGCWAGYQRTPGTKQYEDGSCQKIDKKKRKKKKRGSRMYKARENASKFPAKGSDADGDGKYREGKKKITDFSDRNGNGKADVFESSSEYDSGSESSGTMQVSVTDTSSDDDGPMKKKRSNASAADEEDCGCGCGGDPTKKKAGCGSSLTKTISKAAKAEKKEKAKKQGVIHRANDGKHGSVAFCPYMHTELNRFQTDTH